MVGRGVRPESLLLVLSEQVNLSGGKTELGIRDRGREWSGHCAASVDGVEVRWCGWRRGSLW